MSTRFFSLLLAFCCVQLVAKAQICNGSLGDPVVNVSFGAGSNPGSPFSAISSRYTYKTNNCINDGEYTIVSSMTDCHNGTWHVMSQDHTPGDANGYMMLVNASYDPGDFYVGNVDGLCGGTTYEFAAWILNLLKPFACSPNPVQPNITFTIETSNGSVLGKYETGTIASSNSAEWKQYGLFFTTPTNTSNVVLRITNNASGGCGNDLALDDITFRPCGPTVQASVSGNTTNLIELCEGENSSTTLQSNVGAGYNNPSYQWQQSVNNGSSWVDIAGSTSNSVQVNPTTVGTHLYRLSVAESGNIGITGCRVATNTITINIHEKPGKNIGSNSPVCEEQSIKLNASTGTVFSWQGPANFTSNEQNPVLPATLNASGTYTVQATDAFGCKGTNSIDVVVNERPVATTPAAISTCQNVPVVLTVGGGTTYEWKPATGLSSSNIASPTATLADTTMYTVIVGNSAGCYDTIPVTVNILKSPVADAGPDRFIFEGQTDTLLGKASGTDINYSWSPTTSMVNSAAIQPLVSPEKDITYQLTVNSSHGCPTATDEVFVRVFNKITVPTAFSPNGDGINDSWRIEALQTYPDNEVTVFNRNGQIVYQAKNYVNQWRGTNNNKPLPTGTYYYIIDIKNNMPLLKGWVLIIR